MPIKILPHALGKKQLTRIIRDLQEISRHSTMQNMSVKNILVTGNSPATFEDGTPVLERNVDDFIRQRLRLHHHSWITDPIDTIIGELVASIYGGERNV